MSNIPSRFLRSWAIVCAISIALHCGNARAGEIWIRGNQLNCNSARPSSQSLVICSTEPLPSSAQLWTGTTRFFWGPLDIDSLEGSWGKLTTVGEVVVPQSLLVAGQTADLHVGAATPFLLRSQKQPYAELPGTLLEFMRQQRCGHNPWLNEACHTQDGRTAFGPMPAGTPIDVSGGWHDAGDMLKYLLTSEDATANLLLAHMLNPEQPHADALLDEAHWGVEWLLKMHPTPSQLYHQVGDDRDHAGFRDPATDPVDYGWGAGGARVAYAAEGKPQGLKEFQSKSDGLANLAGVYAAAMGLAYQTWHDDPLEAKFAVRCLTAGREVYAMGLEHPGVQQGNSYKEPYRYSPTISAGAMEWGASELYRATRELRYLEDAKRFAKLAVGETWMGKTQTDHYQFFPFLNLGHYRLYEFAGELQPALAADYAAGIDASEKLAAGNPFEVGVPFIWCSNNLVVALTTQCDLYERMTHDRHFDVFAAKQLDWLLGRNPWGTTMFTGVGTVYPRDAHLMTFQLLHRPVRGGLVDGPVYDRIFKSLKGVGIREPDPLADFQGPAVYHDDGKDYSSNEPTLDGTASAILMFAIENSR